MIRALLFAAAMSATMCVLADNSPTPAAEERPGYGVVQSITPVRAEPAEESASAGSSAPTRPRTTYLVRVKLDDGSIQIRQLKKRSIVVGKRVLITNAGDVLPDGSRPSDGAITGGSIVPGESGGVPSIGRSDNASERIKRCNELTGTLRDQCLLQEQSSSTGGASIPGTAPGAADSNAPGPRIDPPPQNPR